MEACTPLLHDESDVARAVLSCLLAHGANLTVRERGDYFEISIGDVPGWKLRRVVLSRSALKHLLDDPVGDVKLEYLERDLLRAAPHRHEYSFPRVIRRPVRSVSP